MLPLVSIITPCYRQAHFLAGAIASVAGQSYPRLEHIVVNDGSDDDTEAVAGRYRDAIRYVSKPNGGLSSARNAGIRVAGGKYVLFLDADDRLHADAVAWLVEAAAGREDRVCAMGCRYFRHDPEEAAARDYLPPKTDEAERTLLFANFAPPHAYLCPRDRIVALGGFDEGLSGSECSDWDLWVRLVLAGAELVTVPRAGAYYRSYPGQMSSNTLRMCQTRAEVLWRIRTALRHRPELLTRWGLARAETDRALGHQIQEELLDAAYLLRQKGAYGRAFGHYLLNLRRARLSGPPLLGLAKLLPHALLRNPMLRALLRKLNARLLHSRPGLYLIKAILAATQHQVFSPRTAGLMRMDALRLRARILQAGRRHVPAQRKLHVGCGKRVVPGWLNVDVAGGDCQVDLASGALPWHDGVFEAIVSQHVIEHLEFLEEFLPLLRELRRVARPGAELWLACPDLEKACRSYVEHKGKDLLEDFRRRFPKLQEWEAIPAHMINSLFHQQGEHKNLYDFDLLRWACEKSGFSDCRRVAEEDLLERFPEFPRRDDGYHSLYVRAVAAPVPEPGPAEAAGPASPGLAARNGDGH